MMKQLNKEVIELLESLAPDANEVLDRLACLSESELNAELESDQPEIDQFLQRVRAKFAENAPSGFPSSASRSDLPGLKSSDQQHSSSRIADELTKGIKRVRENAWALVAILNPANALPTKAAFHFSTLSTAEDAPKVIDVELSKLFEEDVLEKTLSWAAKPYRIEINWSLNPEQRQLSIVTSILCIKRGGQRRTPSGEVVVRIDVGTKTDGCRLRAAQSSMPILFTGIDPNAEPKVFLQISG